MAAVVLRPCKQTRARGFGGVPAGLTFRSAVVPRRKPDIASRQRQVLQIIDLISHHSKGLPGLVLKRWYALPERWDACESVTGR